MHQVSYGSPGRPSGSGRSANFGQFEKRGSRSRWQRFTDVFTTRSSPTLDVRSQNHPTYDIDEVELLQ